MNPSSRTEPICVSSTNSTHWVVCRLISSALWERPVRVFHISVIKIIELLVENIDDRDCRQLVAISSKGVMPIPYDLIKKLEHQPLSIEVAIQRVFIQPFVRLKRRHEIHTELHRPFFGIIAEYEPYFGELAFPLHYNFIKLVLVFPWRL